MRLRPFVFACAIGSVLGAETAGQAPAAIPTPSSDSSAGPAAYSCGAPTTPPPTSGRGAQPIFPSGRYPVSLPAVSLLGARNDLPNPFQPGADWGQLPPGRKWGSTASITTAPDGTIWWSIGAAIPERAERPAARHCDGDAQCFSSIRRASCSRISARACSSALTN